MKKNLLITIIALLFLVGCTQTPQEESEILPTGGDVTNSEDEIDAIINFVDDREKTLNIVSPTYMKTDELSLKAINKYLYEMGADYKIEFQYLDEGEIGEVEVYTDAMYELLESGEKIDLFYAWGNPGYEEKIPEHALVLNDYLESENGKALKNSVPDYVWEALKYEGNIYGTSSLYNVETSASYIVSKDLMEKYSFKEEDFKAPLEDIYDMIKKVYEKENFRPLVHGGIGYNYGGDYTIYSSFLVDRESGKVKYFLDVEENVSYLKTIYNLVDEDMVVDLSATTEPIRNWFVLANSSYSPEKEIHNTLLLNDEGEIAKNNEDYVVIAVDDKVYYDSNITNGMCVSKNTENMEESLDFLTKYMSDEKLVNLFIYGVENANYVLDEQGRVVFSYEEKGIDGILLRTNPNYFYSNTYLALPQRDEFTNKTEILKELEAKAVITPYGEIPISRLLDEKLLEKVNEQTYEAVKEVIKTFSPEVWEDMYESYVGGLDHGSALMNINTISGFVDRILGDATDILSFEEIEAAIRKGFDTAGGKEIIEEMQKILDESNVLR